MESTAQTRVWVNGTLSVCRGDCSYEYLSPPDIPSIDCFSESGVYSGSNLTINGANFPTANITHVEVGFVDCPITQ
jgi:hypothetical protein